MRAKFCTAHMLRCAMRLRECTFAFCGLAKTMEVSSWRGRRGARRGRASASLKLAGVMSGPVEASASARRGVDSVTVAVLLLAVMPFTTDWMPQASAEEEAAERAAIVGA